MHKPYFFSGAPSAPNFKTLPFLKPYLFPSDLRKSEQPDAKQEINCSWPYQLGKTFFSSRFTVPVAFKPLISELPYKLSHLKLGKPFFPQHKVGNQTLIHPISILLNFLLLFQQFNF